MTGHVNISQLNSSEAKASVYPKYLCFRFFLLCFKVFFYIQNHTKGFAWNMKSIVAQTENQLRPMKVSRLVSMLKGSGGESFSNSSAVYKLVAKMMVNQPEFRWTSQLASLARQTQNAQTHLLWRPYVNFNARLTRKLSGAMERRGSSISFLRRSLPKGPNAKQSTTCVLPVKTRLAPKTLQGREWAIWRKSSVRPLLLPSSNMWTGVLSQRFYVPRLGPAEEVEEEVERQAVPQLRITREQAEDEEHLLQRRRDGSRLRNRQSEFPVPEREVDFSEHRDESRRHRQPYVPSELMTPELATKWITTKSSEKEHRAQQLLNLKHQMKIQPSVRMKTQTWVSGNRRRSRSRRPSVQKIPVVSELEGWRRSANHQPVPLFQGEPAEQEHLRHASCKTSARSMKDVQTSSTMIWVPKDRLPWGRTNLTSSQSVRRPTIRAAKSTNLMAQESRAKHRLIPKEIVYRPRAARAELEAEEEEENDHSAHNGEDAKKTPEQAMLKEHLADLFPLSKPSGSYRIGYQPNAPTRQLLEQGKCHVSVRREQFIHLQPVRSRSLIQSSDLEVRESPRQAVTTLHRRDGAKRPRPVEVVVKPSLLTIIRQHAHTWDNNGRRAAGKRSNSIGVRPKKQASLRRLVRNSSSLEFVVKTQPKPKPTLEHKTQSSVNDFHNVAIKKFPNVTSKLGMWKAAHPFKDLEEPRIKEKEVATSWKQANAARNYKYEATTSYRRKGNAAKKISVRDMTESYFLAKRNSSTSNKVSKGSMKKVKPPRQPVINTKVQVPDVQCKQKSHESSSRPCWR
ncbi:protein xmas-1 [Drosophila eugracilis]|uniref:protein xmas-1 n=1 Tax=Drosophila eugracilis TaxID=29029 RepID=UPI001BDB1278|nr:protein xmas-1 [Drosophila eugracilis]